MRAVKEQTLQSASCISAMSIYKATTMSQTLLNENVTAENRTDSAPALPERAFQYRRQKKRPCKLRRSFLILMRTRRSIRQGGETEPWGSGCFISE